MAIKSVSRSLSILLFSLLIASTASAGPYADALGKCLVSSTTKAERTTLIQWMFLTLALHPDVQALSAATPQQRDQSNKAMAHVFEQLLTVSCVKETKDAMKYEGTATIETAFSLLGQVAMRELLTDPHVTAGLEDMAKHIDQEKLKAVFGTSSPNQ